MSADEEADTLILTLKGSGDAGPIQCVLQPLSTDKKGRRSVSEAKKWSHALTVFSSDPPPPPDVPFGSGEVYPTPVTEAFDAPPPSFELAAAQLTLPAAGAPPSGMSYVDDAPPPDAPFESGQVYPTPVTEAFDASPSSFGLIAAQLPPTAQRAATAANAQTLAVRRAEMLQEKEKVVLRLSQMKPKEAARDPVTKAKATVRAEVESLPISALHARAVELGASTTQIDTAEDSADERAALLALIETWHPLIAAATAAKLLSAQLSKLKPSELRKRAVSDGVTIGAIGAAKDSSDPKAALIDLITKRAARNSGDRVQSALTMSGVPLEVLQPGSAMQLAFEESFRSVMARKLGVPEEWIVVDGITP